MLLAVPVHGLPGRGIGSAGQHGDVVAALLKVARQHLAYLSAAAGQDDAQRAYERGWVGCHGLSSESRP